MTIERFRRTFVFALFAASAIVTWSCTNTSVSPVIQPTAPKTYMWLFPDSSLAFGTSKQLVHWWGDAPNSTIRGYLFASGRLPGAAQGRFGDSTIWRWKFGNDTLVAFPLRTKADTFQIAAKAVDNAFQTPIQDNAIIRFVTGGTPYWDKNADGRFDSSDVKLPTLIAATDPKGASLNIPVLNSPPTIVWGQDPNNPGNTIQQPDTTFTVATFSWVGHDPDGDSTIAQYELALNDTTDTTRIVKINSAITMVTLNVPRTRSNGLVGTQEVTADLYSGTMQTGIRNIGQIAHLKLNSKNVLYVRARDIAAAPSYFIALPGSGDTSHIWYVKNPTGNVLIVDDYISSDKAAALTFYEQALPMAGYPKFDVINIGSGLSAQDKSNSVFGALVPTFIDPAFVLTLYLYDAVIWYTDPYPSLTVAQIPLYDYTTDQSRHGKVIFSTEFLTASDPRGALVDFAPLDSIGSADLSPSRLLPSEGDTRVPAGFTLNSDSAATAFGFGNLTFSPAQANYSVYLRPIYKRVDADYLYQIQPDSRTPMRYLNLATINSISEMAEPSSNQLWESAQNGDLLHSTDGGNTWKQQTLAGAPNLDAVTFPTASHGIVTGDEGSIYSTSDGGTTWIEHSLITLENLEDVSFLNSTSGYICGTTGTILHSTDGGNTWTFQHSLVGVQLNSIRFFDANNGVAVGDSGTIVRTTNGGTSWTKLAKATPRQLFNVRYVDAERIIACGAVGALVVSTNGGATWGTQSVGISYDIHGLTFIDTLNGWLTAANGNVFHTTDGGITWANQHTGIEELSGVAQVLNDVLFDSPTEGYAAGTGGLTLKTTNGGTSWFPVPAGPMQVACVDGVGTDGKRSIVFVGLPLHYLNGNAASAAQFFQLALHSLLGL
jgi:photosystem II stability/assembly factor-like uncharacterized protein